MSHFSGRPIPCSRSEDGWRVGTYGKRRFTAEARRRRAGRGGIRRASVTRWKEIERSEPIWTAADGRAVIRRELSLV
jgi:hypothetical protein